MKSRNLLIGEPEKRLCVTAKRTVVLFSVIGVISVSFLLANKKRKKKKDS